MLNKLATVVPYLQFKSLDDQTPAGRAAERLRLAAWSTLASLASRGLAIVLMVMGVALTLPYLGSERFGLWMTFSSMVLLLSLLDMGIGHALLNRVAQAKARDSQHELDSALAGGLGLLLLIGLGAGALLSVLASVLPWGSLFKLSDAEAVAECRAAAQVLALCFAVHLVATGLLRAIAGQQRGHAANLVSCVATALACVAVWTSAREQAGVPWLIGASFGLQAGISLVGALGLLAGSPWQWRELAPAVSREGPPLMRTGALFMALQCASAFGWYSDSVILAHLSGPAEVAALAVAVRLFQFASQPFVAMNSSLWAAYAEAAERRETDFIRTTLRRSMLVTGAGSALLAGLILLVADPVIALWTRGAITVPAGLLVMVAACAVLEATGHAFGMYLNGCGIVREQLWVAAAFCTLSVLLKCLFGLHWGSVGIVSATVLAYLLAEVGLYGWAFRRQALAGLSAQTS